MTKLTHRPQLRSPTLGLAYLIALLSAAGCQEPQSSFGVAVGQDADAPAVRDCPTISVEEQAAHVSVDVIALSMAERHQETMNRQAEAVFERYFRGDQLILTGRITASDNRSQVISSEPDGAIDTTQALATLQTVGDNLGRGAGLRLIVMDPASAQRVWLTQFSHEPGRTYVSMIEACASAAAAHYTCEGCAPDLKTLQEGSQESLALTLLGEGTWGGGGGDVRVTIDAELQALPPTELSTETLLGLHTDNCAQVGAITGPFDQDGDYRVLTYELWDEQNAALDLSCSAYEHCTVTTLFEMSLYIHREDASDRGISAPTLTGHEVCCTEHWDLDLHGAGLPSPFCF